MQATWTRQIYSNKADFSAVASSNTEASLLAGPGFIPVLRAPCLENPVQAAGRSWRVRAAGVLSTTGTPTLVFQARLDDTGLATNLTGASLAQSAAITTTNNSANAFWWLDLTVILFTPGQGAGACTLSALGKAESPAGFASPFAYGLVPSSGSPATWTQTVDGAIDGWLNLSVTWSASSASNTITCKQLTVEEMG